MIDLIAAVSQRYGGNGQEQRCAQLCRVRKKEKEDKGGNGFGANLGGRFIFEVAGGFNFRAEGGEDSSSLKK